MELNCCCASGSRRSCASAAITNALNGADVVAVVVAAEHEGRIAAAVRRDIEAQPGACVLPACRAEAPWLMPPSLAAGGCAEALGAEPAGECCKRSVLVWEEIDAYIHECPDRFDQSVSAVCRAISGASAELSMPFRIHRAVLMGGNALYGHLERVAAQVPDEIRFRYILVQ
ncbi:MAG TPA: hypothetical protein VK689_09325 [Armatimonadota bacterium]|nr:hypothetical protein [Armatimonadota bacterium]